MLRKISFATLLLPLSFSAWSLGSYIGIGVGPDLINFKQQAVIEQLSTFSVIEKTHLSSTGVLGTLFAGYARMYNWLYLAAEINGNLSSTQYKQSNSEFTNLSFSATKYKMNRNYGIGLLPGYLLNDTALLYLRLAYANGHFKSITSDISLGNVSKNLDGLRAGIGLKQAITPHLGLRLEYSYINYQKIHFNTFDPLSSTTKATTIHPQANQVEFGLVYNFDTPIAISEK